jgi:hypothetical protein
VHTTAASNAMQALRRMCQIGFIALDELLTSKKSLEQMNADRATVLCVLAENCTQFSRIGLGRQGRPSCMASLRQSGLLLSVASASSSLRGMTWTDDDKAGRPPRSQSAALSVCAVRAQQFYVEIDPAQGIGSPVRRLIGALGASLVGLMPECAD